MSGAGTQPRPHRSPERALALLASHVPIRGRERLASLLFARNHARSDWWTVRIGRGLRVRLPASSEQSWVAAFTGAYDEKQVSLLVSHLRPGTVALDIGASLGLYTVQLAQGARTVGAKVIAIEPIPANAAIIRTNIELNGLGASARVVEVALGIEAGSVAMVVERGGLGNATVSTGVPHGEMDRHSSHGNLGPEVTIAVTPLDALPLEEAVSVVKIDAEGYEMDILAGAEAFFARHRPVILAEFSEQWMRSRGRSPEEPFAWAEDHGYDVHRVAIEASGGRIVKRTELRITRIDRARDRGATELLLTPR